MWILSHDGLIPRSYFNVAEVKNSCDRPFPSLTPPSLILHSTPHYRFSGTKITDAGVFALAGALMVNQNLEKIE